jgi:hypothetical protein
VTDGYYIEQGPPCGSGLSTDASALHGPYETFVNAVNATDAAGTSLLRGHTPLKIVRDICGGHWEVWLGASDRLVTP